MKYTRANLYEHLTNEDLIVRLDCNNDIFITTMDNETIYGVIDYSKDIEEWEIKLLFNDFNEFCEHLETKFKPTQIEIIDLLSQDLFEFSI
jgi:hypothetical protein